MRQKMQVRHTTSASSQGRPDVPPAQSLDVVLADAAGCGRPPRDPRSPAAGERRSRLVACAQTVPSSIVRRDRSWAPPRDLAAWRAARCGAGREAEKQKNVQAREGPPVDRVSVRKWSAPFSPGNATMTSPGQGEVRRESLAIATAARNVAKVYRRRRRASTASEARDWSGRCRCGQTAGLSSSGPSVGVHVTNLEGTTSPQRH